MPVGVISMHLFARCASMVSFVAALLAVLNVGCGATTPPQARDPGAIAAAGTIASPLVQTGSERTVYARIRINTLPRAARPRGAVNVALAMDTSGSMEGAAIVEARRAALRVIDALKDGDFLAVVVFHSRAEVLL